MDLEVRGQHGLQLLLLSACYCHHLLNGFFLRGGIIILSLRTGKRLTLTFPIQYAQILGWIFRDNHLVMHREGTNASGNQRLRTSNLWKVNLHRRHLYADLPREPPAGILVEQDPNAAIQAEKDKDKIPPVPRAGMRTVALLGYRYQQLVA